MGHLGSRQRAAVISVAMTTFEGAKHLGGQLASLLSQSRAPDEIVVCDDASTDGTWELLEAFSRRCPSPVRLLRQERNVGLRRNIQTALAACRGDVLVLADQDDLWDRDKLLLVEHGFADSDVTLWFSNATLIDPSGTATGTTAWDAVHLSLREQREIRDGAGLRRLLHGMTVTGATMAVRRDVLRVALPLPPQLEGVDHLFLHDGWLAVLAHVLGRTVVEPRCLTLYRQHPGQTTAMSLLTAERAPVPAASALARGARGLRWDQLAVDRARVQLVADRVRGTEAVVRGRPDAVEELFALDSFLGVRSLPRDAAGRRRRVLGKLREGAYARFAGGLRTALLDLL